MSRNSISRIVLVLLATVAIANTTSAQEAPKPTAEHKVLAQDVGKWKTEVQMFVPGQDEPAKSEGTEVGEAICHGLFVQTVHKGEIMGMPFEGRSWMGYDTFKKKYTGTWVDNFGTSLYQMEGTYDADKKTMTVMMTGPNPMTGEDMSMKSVTTYIDDNTKTMEMFGPDPTGQSTEMVKMMSMRSVRQK
jgi:hypothetical protein